MLLSTVPTTVTAHLFCAPQDNLGILWVVLTNTGIFLCGKQNLASALGIPKENWG